MAVLLVLTLLILMLPSCASVDKDDAVLSLNWVRYEYHENTNRTTVYCDITIQNDTIYTIDSFELNLATFSDGVQLANEVDQYEQRVKHGESGTITITFTAEGKVDRIDLASWTPHCEPLWKTYINAIVILSIAIVAGVFFWIKEEFF